MKPQEQFIIIGENIHTTRVLLKKGKRYLIEGSEEYVLYSDSAGRDKKLALSESAKLGQDYDQGRIKHVKVALQMAMGVDETQDAGKSYLNALINHQVNAGAHYLDLNVDEISLERIEQERAMEWLAGFVSSQTELPLAIDSSAVSVIKAGIVGWEAGPGSANRPLLNSASLERLDVLDLVADHGCRVVITAAGESGMPYDSNARVANLNKMISHALERGIAKKDLFLDPLVFPIAVDGEYGQHVLDAISELRELHGPEIHITGGFSNVSFGIPERNLINAVFVQLAVDYGADSGIVDPLSLVSLQGLDEEDAQESIRLAEDVLLGRDPDCSAYIRAWREKRLRPLPRKSFS